MKRLYYGHDFEECLFVASSTIVASVLFAWQQHHSLNRKVRVAKFSTASFANNALKGIGFKERITEDIS